MPGNCWLTKLAVLAEAANDGNTFAAAAGVPSSLNSSRVTVAAPDVVLATAIPLSMLPADAADVSTYIRNAVPELTDAAASVAVTPVERFCENSTIEVGPAP